MIPTTGRIIHLTAEPEAMCMAAIITRVDGDGEGFDATAFPPPTGLSAETHRAGRRTVDQGGTWHDPRDCPATGLAFD
jgi:hypothetical protein